MLGLAPAAAEEWEEHRERRRWRRRHRRGHRHFHDQEVARRALQEGRARPLAEILTKAKDSIGGDVIGVELEEQDGAMVYELKVLRADGELAELRVDALTGAMLRQDDD
ncbi:MAG: PepSY domain-containing protein [Xanthobacteraceae bacterium]